MQDIARHKMSKFRCMCRYFVVIHILVSTIRFSVHSSDNSTPSSLGRLFNLDGNFSTFFPSNVCYESVGCFSNQGAFYSNVRPVINLPLSPEYLDTKFILYTRDTMNGSEFIGEEFITGNLQKLKESHFNGDRLTKFIVHGFIQNVTASWIKDMAKELLIHDNFNVIAVDWGKGASWPYMQAVANARLIGVQIAQLISFLVLQSKTKVDRFHIIGHSLGAHVAGYAGQRLNTLKRISGLDPANVFFKGVSREVRLDITDAQFVDVVHTDGGPIGFGLLDALGHVDFYPNRGFNQPGCLENERVIHDKLFLPLPQLSQQENSLDKLGCSHHRAIDYFIESINSECQFYSFQCPNWWKFQSGRCWPGKMNVTATRMGFHAAPLQTSLRQTFLLRTAAIENLPFCVNNYRMQLKVGWKQLKFARGHVSVKFIGDQNKSLRQKEVTHMLPFETGPQTLFPYQKLTWLFHSRQSIKVTTAIVKYIRDVSYLEKWLYNSGLYVTIVTVQTMNSAAQLQTYDMCTDKVINSGSSRILRASDCTAAPVLQFTKTL